MNYKKKIKSEGDYKEWFYESKNGLQFKCIIRRNVRLNNLCGYVEITKDNKLFGIDYMDIDVPLSVHGGITWSALEGDFWVFGFDCAHPLDLTFTENFEPRGNGNYRDIDWVTTECESLAEQLSKFNISIERNKKIDDCLD